MQLKTRSEERIAILSDHDHAQSFSSTHNLRFGLIQRYAWRRRRSYTTKYTFLQDCHVLYSKRIRQVDDKINKNNTQEHLVTTQAHRRAPGKPGATTLTTECLAYSIQQSNSRSRIAETVKKLIQESFLQDLNTTEEINEFSEKSQKLIADMNDTEIFVLCETSSKKQCTDCAPILGDRHCLLYL